MEDILQEFKDESSELVDQILEILEEAEESYANRKKLEEFGQIVDRIMGGAQSMAMATSNPLLDQIGKYAQLCKTVGYKGSQIDNDEAFYTVIVAFLLDATEMLQQLIDVVGTGKETSVKEVLSLTFLDRLQWIAQKFDNNIRGSVATSADKKEDKKKQSQEDIDALLKSLGIG